MSEAELAKIVIDHFESLGYESYKEVYDDSKKKKNKRTDIVFVKGEEHIIVETKIGFGLTVIDQAYFWKDKSHKTFICCPSAKRRNTRLFGYRVCQDLGIGVLEVTKANQMIQLYDSSYCSSPKTPNLYEEQKDSIAGTTGHSYVTPFSLTVGRIYEYLKENGDVTLNQLVKDVDHHYKTEYSAKQSLEKMIKVNVIDKAQLYQKGKVKYVRYTAGIINF